MSIIVSDKLRGVVTEQTLEGSPQTDLHVVCDGKSHKIVPEEFERNFKENSLRIRFRAQPPFWDIIVSATDVGMRIHNDSSWRCRILRLTRRDETSVVCEIILENPNT